MVGLKETVRCLEYKMDRSKPKIIQNFDIPFNYVHCEEKYYEDPTKNWEDLDFFKNITLFKQ